MADSLPSKLGFIGLGAMGLPMVKNLASKLPKSSSIYIFDINQAAVTELTRSYPQQRIQACSNAREVCEQTDTIMTMVPEGSHVRSVYLTESTGVLAAASIAHKLFVDCSTIDTKTSLEVKVAIAAKDPTASFYDAPVSGGVIGAEKATMTIMLGCSEDDANMPRLKTLLCLVGGNIVACGAPSLGLTAKLCNNYCSALIAIATSEAMNIGIHCGMDPRILSKVFSSSLAQSTINDKWNPVPGICPDAPASKGYAGGFKIELMRKDFNLALQAAEAHGVKLSLGKPGLEVYTDTMNDETCRGLDSRVVFRHLGGDEDWEKHLEGRKARLQ